MTFRFAVIVFTALCVGSLAFAPSSKHGSTARGTSLHMSSANRDERERKTAAAFLTAAYLMANTLSVAPAFAAFFEDPGTSQIIVARSGGRAGGRASSGGAKANYNTNKQIQQRREAASSYSSTPGAATGGGTTVVTPVYSSPMYAPPPMYGSPGPDMTGVGLGLGLSAVNSIGTAIRENRQENEIRESRRQLTETRMKEAELEARLKALESAGNRAQ